jgi:hypothetical protein
MPVLPDCIIAMFGYDFREGQASCAELLADSLLSLPTGFTPMRNSATEMWHSVWKPLVIVLPWTAIVLVVLYIIYRLVDPLPPRYLAIAAGMEGSGYDNFARQYARVLARQGVELQTRNSAGAVENLDLLRDPASGVQAALTTFGVTQPADAEILYSLGGIFDAAIFIFYKSDEPITVFAQFRGKRAFPSECREVPYDRLCWRF